MSKIKDFLLKLIFEDEPEDAEEELRDPYEALTGNYASKPPVVSEKPAERAEKPENKQEVRPHSPVIDLTAGERLPETDVIIIPEPETNPVQPRKTFIDVGEKPAQPAERAKVESVVTEEPKPQVTTAKPEPAVKQEYVRTAVISPFFGVKQEDDQDVTPPETITDVQLVGNRDDKDSVIGTVFSPLYGDKTQADSQQHDVVDDQLANMTVDEVVAVGRHSAAPEETEPEPEPVIEETPKKEYRPLKSTVTSWAPAADENRVKETGSMRPDLNVTPFGVSKPTETESEP
ncbi:MAG: hypothetical protein IJI05_02145, partial [Erysipelotrichaceae bacterium]|nr:hypothetical protein [Erysipelotrichaceae bacterium]